MTKDISANVHEQRNDQYSCGPKMHQSTLRKVGPNKYIHLCSRSNAIL